MTMINRIEIMLINQLKKYHKDLVQAKRSTSFDFEHIVFRNLIDRVISHAIWKIHDQFKRLKSATKKNFLSSCTRVFTKIMGLSCSYLIEARIEAIDDELERIHLSDVDIHWWFKKLDLGIILIANFVSNYPAINEALAKSLGAIENVLDIDLDLD